MYLIYNTDDNAELFKIEQASLENTEANTVRFEKNPEISFDNYLSENSILETQRKK